MSYYWARFTNIREEIFRFDTRIYLESISRPLPQDLCIGAIVGKNPGSAKANNLRFSGLQEIRLDNDKLLPTVKSIITQAFKYGKKNYRDRSFVQVLNLFYLCNPILEEAVDAIQKYKYAHLCDSEKRYFPWIWYVWGGADNRLTPFKSRFSMIKADYRFYYDKVTGTVRTSIPTPNDFARHTQGLKHDLIIPYISSIL